MANTYTLIASSTVGSGGAASIDFTSIASTWTDLVLKASIRVSPSTQQEGIRIRFNSDSGLHYADRAVYGTGSAAASIFNAIGDDTSLTWTYVNSNSSTSNTFGNLEMYLPNYLSSNQKSMSVDSVTENNATAAGAWLDAGLWNQTSAITSVSLIARSGTILQYSTAYLYGVKNA